MEVLMKKREKIMEYVFLLAAVISIVAVALICIFLFANGIPAMKKIGFAEFLTGTKWKPGNNKFGIFPMILGSIYVTGGALIIGVPVGVLTSIFMARFCPEGLYKLLKPVVNLLAGIPSIVYGFFGLVVLVPFIREHRTEYSLCVDSSGNHDPADHHRSVRTDDPRSGAELLRRSAGARGNA